MFFKTASRTNPQTKQLSIYYRLVENSRNVLGDVYQRTILSVGFMDDLTAEELHLVQDGLNDKIEGTKELFTTSLKVQHYIDLLYQRLVSEKKIDRLAASPKQQGDWHNVNLDTLENKDVRELGAEWMSLQTLRQLQVDSFLTQAGWSAADVSLALAHICSRCVYPVSELKTVSFMKDNSSICELTGLDPQAITKDKLYRISHKLFEQKEGLEKHLSHKTNELFDIQDKIILYDLTNTYFEGEKRTSKLARRGRSKEKRNDCPLMVLALVVNVEGFIKYSAIYEGNKADCTTLGDMIDKLRLATADPSVKAIVVIDAGIATEDNLKLITAKGYEYVCVSRSNLKNYSQVQDACPVVVQDRKKRQIELLQVQTENKTGSEYYLKVTSPLKVLKERSMYDQFSQRFEEGLTLIAKSITSKHGVKKYDRVNQRIGRLKQKYPSVQRLYKIHLAKDQKDICTSMRWETMEEASIEKTENLGVYFLRTSIEERSEKTVWTIYNCIREIENSFRTLKTDLDLRPVFHKSDDASQAHLHLGLLAYWVVNTVRFQLHKQGIRSQWKELVRVMNTQKCVTTTVVNDKDQQIKIRTCSKPSAPVKLMYRGLKMKEAPFLRKKSVVLKTDSKKNENQSHHNFNST